jgi:hypothetical protein
VTSRGSRRRRLMRRIAFPLFVIGVAVVAGLAVAMMGR